MLSSVGPNIVHFLQACSFVLLCAYLPYFFFNIWLSCIYFGQSPVDLSPATTFTHLHCNAKPLPCLACFHLQFLQVVKNSAVQICSLPVSQNQSDSVCFFHRGWCRHSYSSHYLPQPLGISTVSPRVCKETVSRGKRRRQTGKRGWLLLDVSVTNCPKEKERHFCFREGNSDKGTKQVKIS